MFTLAHLSDPHLAPLPVASFLELAGKRLTGWLNWQRKRRLMHDRAVLERIVADIAAQKSDHIAVTGDIANIGLPAEYTRGREWLDALGSGADVSFIPGNHDIYVAGCAEMAARAWGAHMRGDDDESFPYARRRGNVALIGVSSGGVTAPFMATGEVGAAQLGKLGALLDRLKAEKLFRVVMIHHPPVSLSPHHKRLIDAEAFKAVIAAHGAELVLHGHDHLNMLNWLAGPDGEQVPAVGVPSASATPGMDHDAAGYNLYRIDGAPGAWHCEMVSRGIGEDGRVSERQRLALFG
ncbi:MAG: metallophosphoesterase [Pseudolabrys sp.]|nr:metallophosphoesterase [Pseudolabrys sp.]MDP2296193.1 metallophosphoesterase [Pseudolabrys sp.]